MFDPEMLAQDVIADIMPILFHEVESEHMLVIDVEEEDFDDNDAAQAYCGFMDTEILGGLKFRYYEVGYHNDLLKDRDAFVRMVCHETVHVMQAERGDEFNHELPYREQPHEIEAYDLEDWLVMYFNIRKQL